MNSNTTSQHHLDEALSASVDGEASELELRQLLKALDDDDQFERLRTRWNSAHTAGAVMRGDDMRFADMDISSQVNSAIQNEQISSNTLKMPSWKEMWGKTGIAAAVALGVLFTFQITQNDGAPNGQIASTAPSSQPAASSVPQWFEQAPILTRAASVAGDNTSQSVFEAHSDVELNSDEELQLRLQHILQQHTQDKAGASAAQ